MKNEPSFYEKQHVVLWKTIRRFMENNTSFLESILCSLGKDLKLGIRYEKLKINSYFCRHNRKTKRNISFFIEIFGRFSKKTIFLQCPYIS